MLRVVDAFGNSGSALSRPGRRYLTAGTRTHAHAALVMRDHGAERRATNMFNSSAMLGWHQRSRGRAYTQHWGCAHRRVS